MQAFSSGGGSSRIRPWRAITWGWVAFGLQSKSGEPLAMFAKNGVALSGSDELLDRN
jgi:hypothetical protein